MGSDAIPSSASGLPARLILGPALRAQSDKRLVRLVREGYESAFEEIVRRYRRPLDRFAAGIVGGRSEDVTQDSFRRALEALRDGDAEIELRPWLYRIVRNAALNDLRDRPPAAAELAEDLIAGGRSAAAVAEERAEIEALIVRLQALPEKQRAALVMRELEGMSHEEIAAALGISGGAARQAIARGRAAVRSGFGAIVPLPLLRALASGGGGTAEAVGAAGPGAALGGAAAIGGGAGAGALKIGLVTVVVAGSISAGVAIEHHGGRHDRSQGAETGVPATAEPSAAVRAAPAPVVATVDDRHRSGAQNRLDAAGRIHQDHRRGHGDGGRGSNQPQHLDGQGHGGGHDATPPPVPSVQPTVTVTHSDHHGDSGGGPGPGGQGGDSHESSGDQGSGDEGGHGGSGEASGGSDHGSRTSGSTRRGHSSDDATEPAVESEGVATAPSSSDGSDSSTVSGGSDSSGGPDPTDDPSTLASDSSGGSQSGQESPSGGDGGDS